MSLIAINTSQNIKINFVIASIGERILAFVLDMLIKVAYIIVLLYLLDNTLKLRNIFSGIDNISLQAITVILFLPVVFYTLVLESLLEGQTLGKKIMKLKVVKIDGYQANFSDYLMRWLFRLVEVYLASGILAVLFMVGSKNTQRLGDMVSGTAVISLKNKVNISHTILEELTHDYIPLFPQVILFNDNDMRIIKDNFYKASKSNDQQVLTKLSNKIKEILKLETLPNSLNEKEFIQVVLKDYNYFTGN